MCSQAPRDAGGKKGPENNQVQDPISGYATRIEGPTYKQFLKTVKTIFGLELLTKECIKFKKKHLIIKKQNLHYI